MPICYYCNQEIQNVRELDLSSDRQWQHVASSESCGVCLEPFLICEKNHLSLACGHNFHAGCIDKWLSTYYDKKKYPNRFCPVCNFVVNACKLEIVWVFRQDSIRERSIKGSFEIDRIPVDITIKISQDSKIYMTIGHHTQIFTTQSYRQVFNALMYQHNEMFKSKLFDFESYISINSVVYRINFSNITKLLQLENVRAIEVIKLGKSYNLIDVTQKHFCLPPHTFGIPEV